MAANKPNLEDKLGGFNYSINENSLDITAPAIVEETQKNGAVSEVEQIQPTTKSKPSKSKKKDVNARVKDKVYGENRDKHVNVLLTEWKYNALKKVTTMQQKSINDAINELIDRYIKNHSDDIELFDKTFKNIK